MPLSSNGLWLAEIITPVIEQGIEQGEFRAVNAQDATLTLAASIEGMLLLWGFAPDMIDLEKQLTASLELILAGLKTG